MQASHVLNIPKNPSLWDIELVNIKAASLPEHDHIVLQTPRNTRRSLLADVAIAKLIATLHQRSGGLTFRDFYDSWTGIGTTVTHDRFLREIDGAAALVYCAAPSEIRHIDNRRKERAPDSLRRDLMAHVARTGYLEQTLEGDSASIFGPSRTFVAIDPEYPVPPGMMISDGKLSSLDNEITKIYRQFGTALKENRLSHAPSRMLYEALYEIFQNTFDHGRLPENGQTGAGIRFIRFYKYIGLSNQDLARRARGFEPLQQYFARRENQQFRFLEVTVGDGGPGILSHFSKSEHAQQLKGADAMAQMNQILTTNLSSKLMPGAGLGLPLALAALSSLRAFASLRSDNLWLYRDFSLDNTSSQGAAISETGAPPLQIVPTERPVARMVGTHFSVLIDFPA